MAGSSHRFVVKLETRWCTGKAWYKIKLTGQMHRNSLVGCRHTGALDQSGPGHLGSAMNLAWVQSHLGSAMNLAWVQSHLGRALNRAWDQRHQLEEDQNSGNSLSCGLKENENSQDSL